jgi:hypothetical protein
VLCRNVYGFFDTGHLVELLVDWPVPSDAEYQIKRMASLLTERRGVYIRVKSDDAARVRERVIEYGGMYASLCSEYDCTVGWPLWVFGSVSVEYTGEVDSKGLSRLVRDWLKNRCINLFVRRAGAHYQVRVVGKLADWADVKGWLETAGVYHLSESLPVKVEW